MKRNLWISLLCLLFALALPVSVMAQDAAVEPESTITWRTVATVLTVVILALLAVVIWLAKHLAAAGDKRAELLLEVIERVKNLVPLDWAAQQVADFRKNAANTPGTTDDTIGDVAAAGLEALRNLRTAGGTTTTSTPDVSLHQFPPAEQ